MKQTEPIVVQRSPLLRDDTDLEKFEIPVSPVERMALRARIQKELLASEQERELLQTCSVPAEIPTGVKRVTELLKGRAKAANPIRDFDKIGFSALNEGVNPWSDTAFNSGNDLPAPLAYGIMAAVLGGIITGIATSNAPISIGVAAYATAPIFLTSWVARTAYNFAAAAAAAVTAPISYAVARVADVLHRPGFMNAKAFLSDVRASLLDDSGKTEMIKERKAFLDEIIAKQEQVLGAIEAPMDEPYHVVKGDKARLKERYLNSKWYAGIGGNKK